MPILSVAASHVRLICEVEMALPCRLVASGKPAAAQAAELSSSQNEALVGFTSQAARAWRRQAFPAIAGGFVPSTAVVVPSIFKR